MLFALAASLGGCNEVATPPDTSGPDAVVERACESNWDCAGGEICRQSVCRLACATSQDCGGATPACDDTVGYCVGCITIDDCGSREYCVDQRCEPSGIQNVPRLVIMPSILDLQTIPMGANIFRNVMAVNTGTEDLWIFGLTFVGDAGFALDIDGASLSPGTPNSNEDVSFRTPIVIPVGAGKDIGVTFRPLGVEAAVASVVFRTNDPLAPDGTTLKLLANTPGPCVKVTPSPVDFGETLVGLRTTKDLTIENCGDLDLNIHPVAIMDDPTHVFGIGDEAPAYMQVLARGQSMTVQVTYFPHTVAALGENGQSIRDEGILRVSSNAYSPQLDVPLSGFGTDGGCPTPVITVLEGAEVLPQTTLHLSAANSTAASGAVTRWEWSVDQPAGSASNFFPGANREAVTFEANIVGEYRFTLNVWDETGTKACSPVTYVVLVASDDAIRVELFWDTPLDLDQADTGVNSFGESVGSDVDLHFLHPDAGGTYFHTTYDCHSPNLNPSWGVAGGLDDPRLDRNDTDGAGPEDLNLKLPEFGATYRVGVHYWDDWGFGQSNATIRVYIYGQLREQWENVQLNRHDMWDAVTIGWPSQAVTRITNRGTDPSIVPNFANEFNP